MCPSPLDGEGHIFMRRQMRAGCGGVLAECSDFIVQSLHSAVTALCYQLQAFTMLHGDG